MLTHRERILGVARGELVDQIPYVPRLDLWHNANSPAGTLPERHKGRTADEISRAEGWPLHKIVPEYLKISSFEDTLHRAIGLYHLKEFIYKYSFSSDIDIKVDREEDTTHVEYYTPLGMVSTTTIYTEEMRKAGASITWVEENAIKRPEDYRVLSYIFGNLEFEPDYDAFIKWKNGIGEDGVAVAQGLGLACASPMHFIQKTLISATEFYYHYNDYQKEMRELGEALDRCYDQVLKILADCHAEAILWGANFDDMITYPSYYKKEITPWIQRAVDILHTHGKIVILHTDGENQKLMDLIADSGADVGEAVTPYPMTKVKIDEYYDRWSRADRLTIWGGIPESLLLPESTTDEEFEAYLDHFFKVIWPGKRLIAGIGDTTPAAADFERLVRIGERVEKEGRLPMKAGTARPISEAQLDEAMRRVSPDLVLDEDFRLVQEDVLKGHSKAIKSHVQDLLDRDFQPQDILKRGMLSAMEAIGTKFQDGSVFIPEVLLAARAMNEALTVLEPYLVSVERESSGKIMIGTVHGDLHDIGKNMVLTMLKGVGFDVLDLGINVPIEEFVNEVAEKKPDILGMSALLTTTMPEMKKVINELEASGLRDTVKIMVGGAPVNAKFARDIGADGYAQDAGEAISLAKKLMQG